MLERGEEPPLADEAGADETRAEVVQPATTDLIEEEETSSDPNPLTYRTVCVRLCDGAYFPISFSTTPEHFARDEDACRSRCGAPARLYVYRNPGDKAADMRDRDGRPYSALVTAFQFKRNFDSSCACRANPWDEASTARHQSYAEGTAIPGPTGAARPSDFAELRPSVTEIMPPRDPGSHSSKGLAVGKGSGTASAPAILNSATATQTAAANASPPVEQLGSEAWAVEGDGLAYALPVLNDPLPPPRRAAKRTSARKKPQQTAAGMTSAHQDFMRNFIH